MAKKKTNKTTKTIVKATKKMAKKNPKGLAILIIIFVVLIGLGVGGYFVYTELYPKIVFSLVGDEDYNLQIYSKYNDPGFVATYNGKDVSSEVKIEHYQGSEHKESISSEEETTYTTKYILQYKKYTGELTRKVNVVDTNPDVTFALVGKDKISVALNSEYRELGVTALYNGKDVSNQVTTEYYCGEALFSSIPTDSKVTYTAKYNINFRKLNREITRTIIVTDVDSIDINFLELGNKYTGDSTFIKAGDTDILIDAGSRNGSAATISQFVDTYCTDGTLEYVIATHAHQDHIAGFVGTNAAEGILKHYKIDTLIDFVYSNSDAAVYNNYKTLRDEQIAAGNIKHHYTAAECVAEQNGASKIYDIAAGITMEILDQKFYHETTSDENDYSVCTLFTQGENHYLFTGDLEEKGEASLVALNNLPEVELFKGGHHGSYTANTDTLLNAIKPKTVCICCCAGSTEYTSNPDNTFPAQAAINRIAKHTEKIYVTTVDSSNDKGYESMNGNINFHCDAGAEYVVSGSNNSTILKETEWFKTHRTWPTN